MSKTTKKKKFIEYKIKINNNNRRSRSSRTTTSGNQIRSSKQCFSFPNKE